MCSPELQYSSVSYSSETEKINLHYGDLGKLESVLKDILAKNWISNGWMVGT